MNKFVQWAALAALVVPGGLWAQTTLIRGATVIGAAQDPAGRPLDVLLLDGRIADIGEGLATPAGAQVVEAGGRLLSPALFAGIGKLGVSEISSEKNTVDARLSEADGEAVRPEFQICDSYNPRAMAIPVTRIEGYGFATIAPDAGASFIAGSGCSVRLDGSLAALGTPIVFVDLTAAGATRGSRSGSWMELRRIIRRADGRDDGTPALTDAGREVVRQLVQGRALLVARIDRAADIQRFVEWAAEQRLHVAIEGGAEAWQVAGVLKAHQVPVFVDPSASLPSSFDMLGATLENAALLHAAGVEIAFSQASGSPDSARRLRQFAGIAVANGLPWHVALDALTRTPARILGLDASLGTIRKGGLADLVLWEGDPLDVINLAERIWLGGTEIPMRSRQTELRDRYLHHHL